MRGVGGERESRESGRIDCTSSISRVLPAPSGASAETHVDHRHARTCHHVGRGVRGEEGGYEKADGFL